MIDVYSFGILIYCVLFDTTRPYRRKSDLDIIIQVKNRSIRPTLDEREMQAIVDEYRAVIDGHTKLSRTERESIVSNMRSQLDACVELMVQCWDAAPSKRPAMRACVAQLKKIQSMK
jgi:Protein tyrosine and serine/threonine kinase